MGDGPLCIAAYVWFRLALCLMVVRCDDYVVVNAVDVYYWHCFHVGHCYPATLVYAGLCLSLHCTVRIGDPMHVSSPHAGSGIIPIS